ncbi:MAG: peptidoglycan editing factor PgeF [candidate division NC10 bacterium]|nr:peptidoglycan editing factor PgeF [candidate division NC10 bacterium]
MTHPEQRAIFASVKGDTPLCLHDAPGHIQSLPLAALPGIHHAFSTRRGGVSRPPFHTLNLGSGVPDDPAAVRENRRRFFGAFGLDPSRVVRVRQAHGDEVLVVDGALADRENFPRLLLDEHSAYDAMVTDREGLALVITTADCLPIFIADPVRRAVAAVHAGWRSTLKGIAAKALAALVAAYATRPADCVAAIGPGILGCCFEVDEPVVGPLRAAIPAWESFARPVRPGHWLLDLAALNAHLLAEGGLPPAQIHRTGLCTACRTDLFYSYRAEKPLTGRMMSALWLG